MAVTHVKPSPVTGKGRFAAGYTSRPTAVLDKGIRSKSFNLTSSESRQSALAVRTTHQEKTYEMFLSYERDIDRYSCYISRAHVLLFLALATFSIVICNLQMSLLTTKTQVVASEEDIYTELVGMKNMSSTLRRIRALSNLFGTTYQRVKVQTNPLTSSYLEKTVYLQLYQVAMQLIIGFEDVRTFDNSIRSATNCLNQVSVSTAGTLGSGTVCPLETAIRRLQEINPQLAGQLREAVVTMKVPLSLVLEQKILDYYPSEWPDVYDPYKFTLLLMSQGRFREVFERADMYFEELEQIVDALRTIKIWPRLFLPPGLLVSLLSCALLLFIVFVHHYSAQIADAFRICQDAVAMSDDEVQSKVGDLSNVMTATLEYKILPLLHPLSGIASLLLSCNRLTVYHLKLLKVLEKSTADIIAASINVLDYISVEADSVQTNTDLANLRSLVEDCLESFRPKATTKQLPLSCTFGAGCPSSVMLDAEKLRRVLNRTLAYVFDHTFDKGLGIEVYINANAIRATRDQENSDLFRPYDIHVEVKGLGVCMENHKAQMMVDTKGLLDRSGQGLRLLVSSKVVQSLGGSMKIQSSPLKGTFFSFAIRAKARTRLLDLHKDFNIIAGRRVRIATLGLSQETRRVFFFLCKDIGVDCIHCYGFQQLLNAVAEEAATPLVAVFLGDFLHLSANPADPNSRPLCPSELFERVQAASSSLNEGNTKVFLASLDSDTSACSTRGTILQFLPHENFFRLRLPVHSSVLIELIIRGCRGISMKGAESPYTQSSVSAPADRRDDCNAENDERVSAVEEESEADTENEAGLLQISNPDVSKLFPQRDVIPECLYPDVNRVINAIDAFGESTIGDISVALAEDAAPEGLIRSRRFVDEYDVSLALARYYQALPETDPTEEPPPPAAFMRRADGCEERSEADAGDGGQRPPRKRPSAHRSSVRIFQFLTPPAPGHRLNTIQLL
uniref:Putative transmembrane protein n=1 Tax=Toxoplasma gondii COUG TaxID=1074873 RepID=A0A2G8Y6N5_TOXGO|nr:putative transmembrane protein [Toxoplasma gondii COUG]